MTSQQVEVALLAFVTVGYVVCWAAHVWASARGTERLAAMAERSTRFVCLIHVGWAVLRTARAGHLPIYNAHEFSATFGGGIVLIALVFARRSGRRELAVWALPAALALLGYAWKYPPNVEPLMQIFQSRWLGLHIATAIIAYSSFATTFAASCLYLFARLRGLGPDVDAGGMRLDAVAYRAAALGFSFLTVAVISGAIWAERVWGRFWSWDPKETWSLVTWFVFAAYLHTRYHRGWTGTRAAVLGIAGFVLVLMTYLGVELLKPGQHDFLLWRRE